LLPFGQNEFVVRPVSALLGILTIPTFYLIGKEFRHKNVGIISATFLKGID
jgi:mannosyltransferase